jgi:hypothetical protein
VTFWEYVGLFCAVCLVSALIGWGAASLRYMELAREVAEMEAAVTAYWDRIRKRMKVETQPVPLPTRELSLAEIYELAAKNGILVGPHV